MEEEGLVKNQCCHKQEALGAKEASARGRQAGAGGHGRGCQDPKEGGVMGLGRAADGKNDVGR